MILRLGVRQRDLPERQIDVAAAAIIGRSASSEVPLDDASVSSRHCRVFFHDNHAFIEDLNSTNGTEVNGQTVSATAELRDGDEIALGETRIRVELSVEDCARSSAFSGD